MNYVRQKFCSRSVSTLLELVNIDDKSTQKMFYGVRTKQTTLGLKFIKISINNLFIREISLYKLESRSSFSDREGRLTHSK